MPEGLLPHQQHISDVSAQNHSQVFAGSARDVYFGASKFEDPQKKLEQACRNTIFLTNPAVDRETLITTKGARVTGTCEWITRHDVYQQWLCGDTRLLWISGGPGKGKTMMSIFLTEELERHTHDVDVVFFFCSAQDEKHNTGIAILRGLIHQMVTKRPQLVRHALPDFASPEQTQQTLSSFEALWLIFKNIAADAELGTMFCVLDGLDECHEDTVRSLVPRIVDLLCCGGSAQDSVRKTIALRLLIVSREVQGLQKCSRVRLDPDNNENVISDIERFVSIRVDELSRIDGFNDSIRRTVQTTLLQRAEGTFLWVGFAVHELSQKQTCSQVLEVLENLPKGLPEIYRRMILRIPVEERQMISSILRWVTFALRPLTLVELASAVGVQSPHQLISLEQAIKEKISLCEPLLKVQEFKVYGGNTYKVSLVHQSARDYLLRKEEDIDIALEEYRMTPQIVHLKILQSCLNCVARSGFQKKVLDLSHVSVLNSESPILGYAAIHWPEHARSCATWDPDLLGLLKHFLEDEHTVRRNWWKAYCVRSGVHLPQDMPLLNMLCYLEFEPLVQVELALDRWKPSFLKRVNRKDSDGNTSLYTTVSRQNKAIVQLLVESGADVKAKNEDGDTALHLALSNNDIEIMQLLVHRRGNTEAKNKKGRTVLYQAAETGNHRMLQLLIDSGADIDARDDAGKTALHAATRKGKNDIVVLLVSKGADVRAIDNNGRTVLHHIVRENSEAVIRLLVDRGAKVGAIDCLGITVLHNAVMENHEAAVQLLVERGADIRAIDDRGQTVLHNVSLRLRSDRAMVRLLLKNGLDIEHKDLAGKTVLLLAAEKRDEATVQALVELGANINARYKNGWTPLHWAITRRHETVINMLLERGADIRAKANNGWTPLHAAIGRRNKELVQRLKAHLVL